MLHGEQRDRRVHVIGRGDHHGVDVLTFGLEHLAIIFVLLRLRVLLRSPGRNASRLRRTARRCFRLPRRRCRMAGPRIADADAAIFIFSFGDLYPNARARHAAESARRNRARQHRAVEEISSGEPLIQESPPRKTEIIRKREGDVRRRMDRPSYSTDSPTRATPSQASTQGSWREICSDFDSCVVPGRDSGGNGRAGGHNVRPVEPHLLIATGARCCYSGCANRGGFEARDAGLESSWPRRWGL